MRSTYQTPARQALVEWFCANPDRHFTAEQVLLSLGGKGNAPAVGKSTVYRQLPRLCEQGLLRRFEHVTPEGTTVWVYQYAADTQCDRHFHLKCRACGRICHLECEMTEELLGHVRAHHGFLVECGRSVLYGLCAACADLTTKGDLICPDNH